MAIGSDGTGWIDFNDYELARTIGVVALALILFEGGLTPGVIEIRPVLGTSISLALIATPLCAADLRARGGPAVRLRRSGGPAARRGARVHGRRRDLRPAARIDAAAPARAHARGRVRPRRPGRRAAGDRLIDWISSRATASATWCCCSSQQLGIGLVVGLAVGWLAVQGFQRAQLATAGLYPVASLATAALAFGARRRAARLRLPGRLPRRADARLARTIPAKQTIATFHQGLAWVAQLGDVPHARAARVPEPARRRRASRDRARDRGRARRAAAGGGPGDAVRPSAGRERGVLGWAGLRGAVPVVLATFPVIADVQQSARVLQHRLLRGAGLDARCRARRSSRSRAASGVTTSEPALPRPLTEAGTIRRLGAEILEYPVAPATTRSSATACATSACRARPWST